MEIIKARLDKILVIKGLVENSSKAKSLIMAGKVLVNNKKIVKSGTSFLTNVDIKILEKNEGWASRGGIKLAYALEYFKIDIKDKICIDLGASTGGFTDVLLSRGAKHIFSVDVGRGQLCWRLAIDNNITIIDKTNVRYIQLSDLHPSINLITCDLSFISLTKALNNILNTTNREIDIIALVKPQFELQKNQIGKRGIVVDENFRMIAIKKVSLFLKEKKCEVISTVESPIKGTKGNLEYFIYAKKEAAKN